MKKILCLLAALIMLCGCNTVISKKTEEPSSSSTGASENYSTTSSKKLTLGDEDIKITEGGTYVLEGTLNGSVIVEVSKEEDVQLVLNGVTINSGDFAGIYIIEGDEITITLNKSTVNKISDSSTYTQIDANEVDALIYSKADLFINGEGQLVLNSSYNHGIVSKDDLIIESGDYSIVVAGVALKGKDLLQINNGTFEINAGKDALKSDNEEDEDRGKIVIENGSFNISCGGDGIYAYRSVEIKNGNFVIKTTENADNTSYKAIKSDFSVIIYNGTFEINSADDGIHSDVDLQINGGTYEIESSDDALHADAKLTINDGKLTLDAHEGLEATYIVVNGGEIEITATDDGINAAQKVTDYTATFEMNDGYITITMGQGDTDAVDSNGYIYINGGTLNINAQNSFDCDVAQEFNGGTVIINGVEVDELPQDMMTQGMGGYGQMGQPGEQPIFNLPENQDAGNYFYRTEGGPRH